MGGAGMGGGEMGIRFGVTDHKEEHEDESEHRRCSGISPSWRPLLAGFLIDKRITTQF